MEEKLQRFNGERTPGSASTSAHLVRDAVSVTPSNWTADIMIDHSGDLPRLSRSQDHEVFSPYPSLRGVGGEV